MGTTVWRSGSRIIYGSFQLSLFTLLGTKLCHNSFSPSKLQVASKSITICWKVASWSYAYLTVKQNKQGMQPKLTFVDYNSVHVVISSKWKPAGYDWTAKISQSLKSEYSRSSTNIFFLIIAEWTYLKSAKMYDHNTAVIILGSISSRIDGGKDLIV